MGDVIPFKESPTLEGPAKCCGCSHEWHAVAPVGTFILECPNCGADKGVLEGMCVKDDMDTGECNHCKSEVWKLIRKDGFYGVMCANCGVITKLEDLYNW